MRNLYETFSEHSVKKLYKAFTRFLILNFQFSVAIVLISVCFAEENCFSNKHL